MKTHTAIKHAAALLSAAILLTLPGRAAQNFARSYTTTTGDSNFGATSSLYASDDYTLPSGTTAGTYSLTAGGTVTGKVLGGSVTALNGNGTVKVLSNGTATFTGTLSALGVSLVNVSNRTLPSYTSSHYIKTWSASKSIPFNIYGIPFYVKGTVKASVDAWFRVDATFSVTPLSNLGGMPRVDLKIGPVADLAASAEASTGVGIDGFASVSVGATGSLRLGKVALAANASLAPTVTFNPSGLIRIGARSTVSLTAETSGINGTLAIWAQAELWPFGSTRVTKTIASYSSGSASVNLLGPVTYTWF